MALLLAVPIKQSVGALPRLRTARWSNRLALICASGQEGVASCNAFDVGDDAGACVIIGGCKEFHNGGICLIMARPTEGNEGAGAGGDVGETDDCRVDRGCERQGLPMGAGMLASLV